MAEDFRNPDLTGGVALNEENVDKEDDGTNADPTNSGRGAGVAEEDDEQAIPEGDALVNELRIELVKALHSAQQSSGAEAKQSFLTQAKEIVFHRDPTNNHECTLLHEFVAEICEFINDKRATMKAFVIDFFEEACKTAPSVVTTILPHLLRFFTAEPQQQQQQQQLHASMIKKALITANNVYRPALLYLSTQAVDVGEEKEAKLLQLKDNLELILKRAKELLQSRHLAVVLAAARILQTVALSFLAGDSSGPVTISGRLDNIRPTTGPDAFTLKSVPRGQSVLLAAKVETDGKAVVSKLEGMFEELDMKKHKDESVLVYLVNVLVILALNRPAVRDSIMQTLLTKGETLEKNQSLRFAQSLKANLFPLLKVDAMNAFAPKIEALLKKLGAATKLIGAAKKVAERQTRSRKRARGEEESLVKRRAGDSTLPDAMLIDPPLPDFSPSQALDFRKLTVQRMLDVRKNGQDGGKRTLLDLMLARVVADFVPPRVAKQAKNVRKGNKRKRKVEEEEETVDEFTQLVDLRTTVIDHVCENPVERMDLVLSLLFQEFAFDAVRLSLASKAKAEKKFIRYDKIFSTLLTRFDSDAKRKTVLQRLFKEPPRIPEIGLGKVFELCLTDTNLGLLILRDIITTKPALRERCIKALLCFTVRPQEALRRAASSLLIARIYPNNSDKKELVISFSLELINSVVDPEAEDPEQRLANEVGMELDLAGEAKRAKGEGEEPEEAMVDVEATAQPNAEEELARKMNLFLSLCTNTKDVVEEGLFQKLMKVYAKMDEAMQTALLGLPNLSKLLNKLGDELGPADSFALFCPYDEKSDTLALFVVQFLVQKISSVDIAQAFAESVLASASPTGQVLAADIRFTILIIGFLPRNAILQLLGPILLLEDEQEKVALQSILFAPQQVGVEATEELGLGPQDLLVSIIRTDVVETKKGAACEMCLSYRQAYPKEVLKRTIEELVLQESESISVLAMDIVLKSLGMDPGLKSFVVDVLNQLCKRQVWNMSQDVWHGFVLCAHKLQTNGFPVFLFLPFEQFKDSLSFLKENSSVDLLPKLQYYYKMNKGKLSNVSQDVVACLLQSK